MKFKYKKDKTFKNLSVNYIWIKSNIFIQINYEVNSKYEVFCNTCHSFSKGEKESISFWIFSNRKNLSITPIAETKAEKELLENCWIDIMQSDYCDTQILMTPSIHTVNWDKDNKKAKLINISGVKN